MTRKRHDLLASHTTWCRAPGRMLASAMTLGATVAPWPVQWVGGSAAAGAGGLVKRFVAHRYCSCPRAGGWAPQASCVYPQSTPSENKKKNPTLRQAGDHARRRRWSDSIISSRE